MTSTARDPLSSPALPDPAAQARDDETLSAWLDGELDAPAAEPLLSGLLQSAEARRLHDEWCLVGDALRSHEVAAGHSPRLCARIADALAAEPALLAPRALAPARPSFMRLRRQVASGAAIAAAAAVVVFVAVPQLRGPGTSGGSELVARDGAVVKRNTNIEAYLQAHRDMAPGAVKPASEVYLRYGNEGDR